MESTKPQILESVAKSYCYVLILVSVFRSFFLFALPVAGTQSILKFETSLSTIVWWLPGAMAGFLLADALVLLGVSGFLRSKMGTNSSFRDLVLHGVVTACFVLLLIFELSIPPGSTFGATG